MEFHTLFKCRKCKVNAESSFVRSDRSYIRCPKCPEEIVGKCAVRMFLQYGEYLAIAKVRYDAVEPRRMASMRMSNLLRPSQYPFADLPEPRGKFFIDINDYFRHLYPYNE